jgi:cytochrome bd-type quinol oxidase subunit 1
MNDKFLKAQVILASVITGGFLITLFMAYWLLSKDIFGELFKTTVASLTGALVFAFSAIVNYYFGSSQGSKDKTEMLKKFVDKEEELPPTPIIDLNKPI